MQQELPFGARSVEPPPQSNLTDKRDEGGDDILTAYIDLALRVYLRIKSEGKKISTSEKGNDSDSELY
jgi:hypothetical protein